jgi:hypothetical protein
VLFAVLEDALTDGTTADVKMKIPASAMALSIDVLLVLFVRSRMTQARQRDEHCTGAIPPFSKARTERDAAKLRGVSGATHAQTRFSCRTRIESSITFGGEGDLG